MRTLARSMRRAGWQRWLNLAMLLSLLAAATMFTLPTQAQPPAFEAILYNPNLGEFVVVDETGSPLERTVLPSLGSQVPSDSIAISDDGQRIAYVLEDTNSGVHDLMIYDRQLNTIAATYRIPNSGTTPILNHSLASYLPEMQNSVFDPTGQFFAFGYNTDFTTWEAIVLDINNGTVRNRITDQTVTFPSSQIPNGNLVIPRQFDGRFMHFTFILTNTGGSAEYPSYTWDTSSGNTLTSIETYRVFNNDFLRPANHHIMAVPDFRLPNVQHRARGPAVQFNALHAATSNNGDTFPVFSIEDLSLSMPRFIQNGSLMTVQADTYPQGGNIRWLVIDPATGQQQTNLGINSLNPHNVLGLPNGLLYSAPATDIRNATGYLPSPNAATTALMYIDTTAGYAGDPGQRIWLDNPNQFAQLVHVTPRTSPPVNPPTWNNIEVDSSVDPYQPGRDCNRDPDVLCGQQTTLQNICQTNPGACQITPGDLIRVNTTEGDLANLRRFPNVDADNVVAQLPNGTDGQVSSGPETADGFTWWEIETNGGQTGWIVERVNDVQVLVKIDPATGEPVGSGSGNGQLGGGSFALTPGGQAIVTPQGDNLNARTQPTTNSRVLAILQAGDIVNVLDGPVQAEGFIWWQVETSEGAAWAADGSGSDIWLRATTQTAQRPPTAVPPTAIPPTTAPPVVPTTPAPVVPTTRPAIIGTEDCLTYNTGEMQITNEGGGQYLLTAGSSRILTFDNQTEANTALAIIRAHGLNQQCFVGRPDPSLTYWLSNGSAPRIPLGDEDCLPIDLNTVRVTQSGSTYRIQSGNSIHFSFGSSQQEADKALSIIQHYGFRYSCFVGRPDPSFTYLRR